MVTIGAFALAIACIAIAIIGYCEFDNYGAVNEGDISRLPNQTASTHLPNHYEFPHKKVTGFTAKCRLIAQFAHTVFFMSASRKTEQVRRNELMANDLINEYKAFIVLPPEERTERFLRWRDDIEYYETHKRAAFSMKSETIEFRVE